MPVAAGPLATASAARAAPLAGTPERLRIERCEVTACTVPTELPEADGTFEWDATTIVIVEVAAGGVRGLGYTYGALAAAALVRDVLAPLVRGRDALDVPAARNVMARALRNLGLPGLGAMALSAVDVALWDLKAKLLGVSLADLLGRARQRVAVYGSGGFTSFSIDRVCEQLAGWVARGFRAVKMKVGADPSRDLERVRAARAAIGDAALFVDANGAYTRKQALAFVEAAAAFGVSWFEEPVSSDDLVGLRVLRDRSPAGVDIAAGEYGFTLDDFRRLIEAEAVDVLQADATRCGGVTGFLAAAALCEAAHLPLSAHTAPALHAPLCCAVLPAVHVEYFHDHARIESMLFDGAPEPAAGELEPQRRRAGLGLEPRRDQLRRHEARF